MLRVYKRWVIIFLIILSLSIIFVEYIRYGAIYTSLQQNDNKVLKQLSPNTGNASKDQSSENTFNLNVSGQEEDETKTKTVIQFRNLVNKLVHCSDKCENITEQETLHLPSNILTDPTFLRVVERFRKSKEGCTNDSPELKVGLIPNESFAFIGDNIHHLSLCFSSKGASTSLFLYSKVLTIYNEITSKIQQLIRKSIRQEYVQRRDLNTLQREERDVPESNLKVAVVRHPFQRLISAYNHRVTGVKYPMRTIPEQFQSMLSMSLLPDSETTELLGRPKYTLKCSHNLKGTVGKLKPIFSGNGKEIPSFRGFVLGVIEYRKFCKGDVNCLRKGERHMMPQVLSCGPCLMNYDAILKVETLNEDIALIERVLGLESAWEVQQTIIKNKNREYQGSTKKLGVLVTNSHKKQYSYRDYMNQLAPHEMDMLYEVYANDFNVYGYDPCQDINSTSHT